MYAAILPRQRLVLIGLALSLLSVLLLYSLFGLSLSSLQAGLRSKFESTSGAASRESNFHLLIPATRSKFYFCQLLFTATVLGWPNPVLIGWDLKPASGDPNGVVSHLFKVSQTLEYLNSVPEEQDDDLVLIIDAYDVWFQLRPDVLIQRYYSVRDAANERLNADLGSSVVSKHGLSQTIFFNADKTLWPSLDTTTDLWWLPNSTLPGYAFGPDTDKGDTWTNRPRWLNSGAVIGPLGDMRRLFNATLNRIDQDFNETLFKDSDQLYFSKLFEDQEYARMLLRSNQSLVREHPQDMAILGQDMETEYHISLDYKSDLFLANAFYEDFVAWMIFDTPRKQPRDQIVLAPYQIDLPAEILSSQLPFDTITLAQETNSTSMGSLVEPVHKNSTWRNLALGTNLITNQVFPLLHMTGHKGYLDEWWNRMWYFPHGRALLTAATVAPVDNFITRTPSDGRIWRTAQGTPKSTERKPDEKVGAWSDQGKWLPWDGAAGICEIYEDHLFGKESLPPPESLDSDLQKKLDAISNEHQTFSSKEAPGAPPQDKHDASMKPPRDP